MGAIGQSSGRARQSCCGAKGREVPGMGGQDSQEAAMRMGRPLGRRVCIGRSGEGGRQGLNRACQLGQFPKPFEQPLQPQDKILVPGLCIGPPLPGPSPPLPSGASEGQSQMRQQV